jgi:hypothetical protein
MIMLMKKSSRGGGWSRRQSEVGIDKSSSGALSSHLSTPNLSKEGRAGWHRSGSGSIMVEG